MCPAFNGFCDTKMNLQYHLVFAIAFGSRSTEKGRVIRNDLRPYNESILRLEIKR